MAFGHGRGTLWLEMDASSFLLSENMRDGWKTLAPGSIIPQGHVGTLLISVWKYLYEKFFGDRKDVPKEQLWKTIESASTRRNRRGWSHWFEVRWPMSRQEHPTIVVSRFMFL